MSDQRRAEAAELAEALRAAARYRPDPDRPPVVLALPFTKSWMAVNTPARRVPSHGTHFGGQTYALDFVAVDERRRTSEVRDWRTFLTAEPVERFSGFGQPILAPADGRVVAVHDGEPDLTARRSPIVAVPYLLTQGSRLRQGFQAVVGNHVIIELDEPGDVCVAGAPPSGLGRGRPRGHCDDGAARRRMRQLGEQHAAAPASAGDGPGGPGALPGVAGGLP